MVQPESNVRTEASDDLRWYLLQKKNHEIKVRHAFEIFREAGIEPILIKGLAAARNYPEPAMRTSGDIDLSVALSDYPAATEILRSNEVKKLNVDLHRELKWLDSVPWIDLFENSRLIELDGVRIRVLRPEDHLRVLCVHWLTDGGAHRAKLWDIYYAVNNRSVDFDWSRCLDIVSEIRRGWVICTIGLAHKYFGLPIDDLPFMDDAKKIPAWIERCVEREWKSDVRLTSPEIFFRDPKNLLRQVRKRFPPNPIQASIEMERAFDDRSRIPVQISNTLRKLIPSAHRIARAAFGKSKS